MQLGEKIIPIEIILLLLSRCYPSEHPCKDKRVKQNIF